MKKKKKGDPHVEVTLYTAESTWKLEGCMLAFVTSETIKLHRP
jgi:hypothetical protein